ncbi:MAG TPA: DNA topoisomerase IB [Casimicrobiaceae bacterium]|jgi:DNA topoisomerase IB
MSEQNERNATSAAILAAVGLVYVSDAVAGIRRVRKADQFIYLLGDEQVKDETELKRIASLAIPPAYEDVWICRNPKGHLQATGRDARGRKQYRYHPKWRLLRDGAKFERMPAFGEALPRLRRRLRRDLALPGLPREKVLAVIVSLLDATRVRIGNAEYARDNDSYGLTTLRNRHVQFVRDGRLLFRFRGKGGAEHEIAVDDKRLARLVRHCHQLPGQRLFQYVDEAGERRPIDSDQVNLYLKDAMGDDFTAKDFRTWGATLRAIAIMHATPLPEPTSERALTACIVDAVRQVAKDLRNTPAVCRKSYINPLVFDAWRSGALHRGIGEKIAGAPRRAERLVPVFLRRQARSTKRVPNGPPGPIGATPRSRQMKPKLADPSPAMRAAA